MISWITQPLPSGLLNEARAVAFVVRSRARHPFHGPGVVEHPAGVMEYLAHVGPAVDELGTGGVDVGHHQVQALAPSPARPR
jgi:hypothetical protein